MSAMSSHKIIFHATPRYWSAVINGRIVIRANILKENTKPVDNTGIELLPSAFFLLPEAISDLRVKTEKVIGVNPAEYEPENIVCWAAMETKLQQASPSVVIKPYQIIADLPMNILIAHENDRDFMLNWTWESFFNEIYGIASQVIDLINGVKEIEDAQWNCWRAFKRQGRIA
jgi:hypothetical protein